MAPFRLFRESGGSNLATTVVPLTYTRTYEQTGPLRPGGWSLYRASAIEQFERPIRVELGPSTISANVAISGSSDYIPVADVRDSPQWAPTVL